MKNKILYKLSTLMMIAAMLTIVSAILTGFTVSVSAGNDGLIGANIQDGELRGYYGDGGDIKIPDTVTVIAGNAFLNNDNITSVTIPGSVQVISYHAFDGCTELERVIFEDPTDGADMIIRLSAFANCPKLTECEIPAVATYVTANVFKGCTSMDKITVHPENPYYFTDENGVMFGPWVNEGTPQYDDPNLTLTAYPSGRSGAYAIPESVNGRTVNRIWASAFSHAEKLTDISIPETVKIIGGNAFENTGLTDVTIPDTVEKLDSGAFEDCKKLTQIKLPKNMTSIPHSIFKGCTSLSQIEFPQAATNIEMYAFANCKSLTNLILPDGLVNITLAAFEGCTNLQRVVIPASVTGFPNDDTLGAYDVFPDSPKTLIVYVEKGSNGERWAVNNVSDWGYQYEILDDVSKLDSVDFGNFYLINLDKKVKVEGEFSINSYLSAEEVYSGSEYSAFKAQSSDGALSVYRISANPDIKDGEYTVSIGIPDGYSKNAKLYFYDDGAVSEISSSQVSKTFTVQTNRLGYFAVIDSSISGGDDDKVTNVMLNKSSTAMKKGDKLQLSATVLPQTAADKSILWESSDSAVAAVDSKGVVTAVSAGSAKITASAANGVSAYCLITVTDSESPEPANEKIETKAALTADKIAAEKGKSYFTLSLSEASRIANIQLTFETSTDDVKISGNNGFTVIGDISGETGGGKYTGTAVLGFLNADGNLFSSAPSTAIAKIIVNVENASLKITGLKVSGWDSDKNIQYGSVNGFSPSEATFTDALTYDVNGDGIVDLLDITEAQLYYRADMNSANWSIASKCDFNGDNRIDIEDYMAIWLNFTK